MRYDVIFQGFSGPPSHHATEEAAVQAVFGVPSATARVLLDSAPCVVKEGVDERDARRFVNAFRYIGADCSVKPLEETPRIETDPDLREAVAAVMEPRPYSSGSYSAYDPWGKEGLAWQNATPVATQTLIDAPKNARALLADIDPSLAEPDDSQTQFASGGGFYPELAEDDAPAGEGSED